MGWAVLAIVSVVATTLCVYVVHRVLPHQKRTSYDEVNGYFFAAAGVFYAVLVAFVVVAVWEGLGEASKNAATEANALPGLYFSSTVFGPETKQAFQTAAVNYARDVVTDEWPRLADGVASAKVDADAKSMRQAILKVEPSTHQQEALYSAMIERVNAINSARRQRLNEAEPSIPKFLWVGLIAGAVLLVVFALFFGAPGVVPHMLMVGVLTTLVVGSLFLIYLMEQPYRGPMSVQPAAFRTALTQMGQPAP